MHAVNALLRAELAGVLARVDAAESPPLRQRQSNGPQESSTTASRGRTAPSVSPAKDSQTSKAWTCSPARTGSPSLSNLRSRAKEPSSKTQRESFPLEEECFDDCAIQTWEQQTAQSLNHATSQAKLVMCELAPVLLFSMTALQRRMAQQLTPCRPVGRTESPQETANDGEQQAQLEEAPETRVHDEHAQQLRVLEERLQQEHALTCEHTREAHAQELQALRESLSAEHTRAAASLARQHSQRLASECERITSRLTEEHVKSLEDLRQPLQQEHAAAMHALRRQHTHELAESRAATQAELSCQHATAESALRESLEQAHAASAQQQLAEQAEKLSMARAQAVANLTADREAAVEAFREQLNEEHAVTCQHMHEMHAQELQAREQQLSEEHAHACQNMQAQHAQQVQDMAAEHAQLTLRMEQGFLEERRRLEQENECQLALVQELAAEQAHTQLQGDLVVSPACHFPLYIKEADTHPGVWSSKNRKDFLLSACECHGCLTSEDLYDRMVQSATDTYFLKPTACAWACAEQAEASESRCSELAAQLRAVRAEMDALQKHAAAYQSLQSATPRKVSSTLLPHALAHKSSCKNACCRCSQLFLLEHCNEA